MVDIVVDVLTPATDIGFISLDELKIYLGIPAADTSDDESLQMLIDMNSATIAEVCNRMFAKEKVRETWRCVSPVCCPDGTCRVYLTHWPVKLADIESVESPEGNVLDPLEYEIEERSGKLLLLEGCTSEIVITYTGGYALPDEAPLPLKQAAGLMVRSSRTEAAAETLAGVRMIAHKNARIMYHTPSKGGSTSSSGTSTTTLNQIKGLLAHYQRLYV